MATKQTRYDEDFKKSIVALYHNGKTQTSLCQEYDISQTSLCQEYDISQTSLAKWIKQYSTVETDDGKVLTAKQIKEMQKRMAQLEEENLIFKKRLPYSRHTL